MLSVLHCCVMGTITTHPCFKKKAQVIKKSYRGHEMKFPFWKACCYLILPLTRRGCMLLPFQEIYFLLQRVIWLIIQGCEGGKPLMKVQQGHVANPHASKECAGTGSQPSPMQVVLPAPSGSQWFSCMVKCKCKQEGLGQSCPRSSLVSFFLKSPFKKDDLWWYYQVILKCFYYFKKLQWEYLKKQEKSDHPCIYNTGSGVNSWCRDASSVLS